MKILEQLLKPHLTVSEFLAMFHMRKPFAAPNQAHSFCNLLSWPMLDEIFHKNHDDCWPVQNGELSPQFSKPSGHLNPALARAAFAQGHTIVVRHAEKANICLSEIAEQFQNFFRRPVDLQLYLTPEGEEGFDWHYDVEDVFVIQCSGAKEFRLLENTVSPRPFPLIKKGDSQFSREKKAPELRCLLTAGDWLYIPAGYWHKARAITDSFHLSIGVQSPSWPVISSVYQAEQNSAPAQHQIVERMPSVKERPVIF
jgi:ribosomal protein L16 Arg81 hydroxylase